MALIRPSEERRAERESSAHRRQQHQTSLLQFAFLARGFHRQRDRSRGGVSVTLDVNDHALGTQIQTIGSRGDDALVRLMRNEGVDLAALEVVAFKNLFAERRHLAHRELEDSCPILMNEVHLLVDRLVSRWIQASATWHVKRAAARS